MDSIIHFNSFWPLFKVLSEGGDEPPRSNKMEPVFFSTSMPQKRIKTVPGLKKFSYHSNFIKENFIRDYALKNALMKLMTLSKY